MTKKEQLHGLVYLAAQLLMIPALIPFCVTLFVPGASKAIQNFASFLFGFICVCVIFRKFLANSIRIFPRLARHILLCALVGICSYLTLTELVGRLTLLLYPRFINFNDSSILLLLAENFPLMAIGTVFLVPVTEELLYRGLVFGGLLAKSKWLAYAVSAALFAAIHVTPYLSQQEPAMLLAAFVQYLPAGISLGWAYHKSGSIFAPILIHATINALGIAVTR